MESTHWVNNFWGKDDAGYHRLMQRMQNSRQTCDELRHFYKERLAIEQDYAKKLNQLAHKALGSTETGGMKQSLETVRATTKATAATHETVARQIHEQLLGPLTAFGQSMKGRNRMTEETMMQLTKAKNSQNHATEKTRAKYLAECNKISGYQAQQNLLMGKELDKNNQRLDRACYQVEGLQRQYQDGIKALAQSIEVWNAEWRVSCDKIERMEEERLAFTKSNLWAYANAVSAACVAVDEGCEVVRTSLEKCDPAQDLELFSKENGTGSQIQDPPEFVNFLQGFSRDTDGDEGRYHLANFGSSLGPETETRSSAAVNLGPVPNLQMSSAAYTQGSSSPSSQGSPLADNNCTPMSSPGAPSFEEKTEVERKKKNRMSWAMPFKRKSNNPDFESALDQPTPSSSFQVLSGPNGSEPMDPPVSRERRKSWAPSQSWAPAPENPVGVGISSNNEDPLLAALERLKAPARPYEDPAAPRGAPMGAKGAPMGAKGASMGAKGASMGANGAPVGAKGAPVGAPRGVQVKPMGSAQIAPAEMAMRQQQYGKPPSPVNAAAPPAVSYNPVRAASPKRPVHRKKVGSDSDATPLPGVTTDGRKVIKHSRAQYDYRAAIPEEVTFKKGDILLITEMQEDGWWDCEVAGRHAFGLAPSNFLVDV